MLLPRGPASPTGSQLRGFCEYTEGAEYVLSMQVEPGSTRSAQLQRYAVKKLIGCVKLFKLRTMRVCSTLHCVGENAVDSTREENASTMNPV